MFPGGGGWLTDQRKIGLGLTAFGFLFTILGVFFFFDRGLLAMGNVGMTMTIGVQATMQFFTQRKNRKGSAFYLGGATLVVVGWTIVGLLVEAYGFWLLFCEFIPRLLQFAPRIPYVSSVFNIPSVRVVLNRLAGTGSLPVTTKDMEGRNR